MLIKRCISDKYLSTNIKTEIMQPLLSKIFVQHMVKVLFQNAHVGNGSQGSEKEISIYPMKVVQADLQTLIKRQFEVLYQKNAWQSTSELAQALGSKVNGTLQFEEDENGESLRCLGTVYIDRKALADKSCSMCFLPCTTQEAVISEPYHHRRWEMDLLQ